MAFAPSQAVVCAAAMKTSVLIWAEREPTLLPRIMRVLSWQGVFPELLHADAVDSGMVRIRLEVACDKWRTRRLQVHWERIVGVQSVTITRVDDVEYTGADTNLPPTAR